MFNNLPDRDYTGIVVGGSNDTMHRGAVRVKILGITNDYEDDEQPYVYPAITTGIQQVPQVGYYLRIRFVGGDINSGYYYAMSQTPNINPAVFTENYPDAAVAQKIGRVSKNHVKFEVKQVKQMDTITIQKSEAFVQRFVIWAYSIHLTIYMTPWVSFLQNSELGREGE